MRAGKNFFPLQAHSLKNGMEGASGGSGIW